MNCEPQWTVYRTRFLVRACQLAAPFSFTDALGREHCGSPGDYLVESAPGCVRITPRTIFEDVYVPLLTQLDPHPQNKALDDAPDFRPPAKLGQANHYSLRHDTASEVLANA